MAKNLCATTSSKIFWSLLLSLLISFPLFSGTSYEPMEEQTQYALVCNGGDMGIRRDENTGSYTLYLYDKDAIFYFVDRSKEMGPGTNIDFNHALEVMIPYRLPDNVEVYAEIDGAIMWVYGLEMKAGGRKFVSYEYGPRLKQVADGYELTLSGVTSIGPGGRVSYKLGTWFFTNCVLNL